MHRLNKILGLFLQLTTMATFKGGYDYEFIGPLPNSLECSICLLTLRDPHIISCCGNHFCHTCIGHIQGDGKPCPLCNEPNFTTFLHKGVKREVSALMIRCRWRQLGCDWEGELGQLEEHLHPGAGSRGKGCGYLIVECVYKCGERFERRMIKDHELDACPRRPMEVQMSRLARKFEASLRANEKKLNDVITVNEAIKDENKLLTRRIAQLEKEQEGTSQKVGQLKEENHQLREKQDNLERELDTRIVPAPVPPFYFTIVNYDHYRKVDYRWSSSPFYSHPGGYKLECYVYTNGYGDGKGTHLSLFVHILRGEYDDQLKWPFIGIVTIEMFNWETKTLENSRSIRLDDLERAIDSSYGSNRGYRKWISLDDVNKKYLRHDNLRFKVIKVELK